MIAVVATLSGGREAARDLESALDREVAEALQRISGQTARIARSDHVFQNRSGKLEQSIGALPVSGDLFSRAGLEAGVEAGMEYGEYVEDNPAFAFLEPAWETGEPWAEHELDLALERAIHAARW